MASSENSKSVEWSSSVTAIKVQNALPDYLQSVNLRYVLRGLSVAVTRHGVICKVLMLIPLLMLCLLESNRLKDALLILRNLLQHPNVVIALVAVVVTLTSYFLVRPRRVFLVDLACYQPDRKTALTNQDLLSFAASTGMYRYVA